MVVLRSGFDLQEANRGEKAMVVAQSGIHLEAVSRGEKVMVEARSGILLVEEASDLGRWPNSHDLLRIKWSHIDHDQVGGVNDQGKCMKASETEWSLCHQNSYSPENWECADRINLGHLVVIASWNHTGSVKSWDVPHCSYTSIVKTPNSADVPGNGHLIITTGSKCTLHKLCRFDSLWLLPIKKLRSVYVVQNFLHVHGQI